MMSNENKTITIREVAADSEVSIATVSRVLNEPWRVKQPTRDRVSASIQKLGFKPNLRARLFAQGGSGTLCFLLSNRPFIHSVHAQILQGAALEADVEGVQVVYVPCHYSPDTPPSEIEMPQILAARGLIDGVILAGTNYPNMLAAVKELGLPHVVFGTNLITDDGPTDACIVSVDDESGGYQATSHLISLGHTKIRFIGDVSLPWYKRRHAGYMRAMSEAGLTSYEPVGSAAKGELAMGYDAVNTLCDSGDEFTALFVGGDMGALGAIKAFTNRGLHVPDDVSIVGFNDEELTAVVDPPLTTIRVPKEEVGAHCVRILNSIINKGAKCDQPDVLPVCLVMRESTKSIGG
ncbi:MAG: LacI family DNA-binding transcriptional regulator [Armatimonadota bacterium]